jgi:hypothetical protein
LVLLTLPIPFTVPTSNLPLRKKLFTLAETKRRWQGMWMIRPIRPMRRWFPRNGLVVEKLVAVAGNLLIPVVSKLNVGRGSESTATINLPKSR